MWIKWVHHFYLKGVSVWEWKPLQIASPKVKFLIDVRDSLILKVGSLDEAIKVLAKAMGGLGVSLDGKRHKTSSGRLYEVLRPKMENSPWANMVWPAPTTPKHSFVLWLAVLGRLRSSDILDFLEIDPTCVFCRSGMETHEHLFFECSFTAELWGIMRNWAGITREMSTIRMALKWLNKDGCRAKWISKLRRHALALTVYFIWCARNRA